MILIVDDSPDTSAALAKLLTYRGYRVQCAPGGDEALECMRADRPDLVILDQNMPGKTGLDVFESMRHDGRLRDVPVIFYSADAHGVSRDRALAQGAHSWVTKAGTGWQQILDAARELYSPRELIPRPPALSLLPKAYDRIMPHIPILRPEDASADARAVYDEFYRRMSFPSPPNFIMTQGHSPSVAKGTWGVVHNVLVLGEIPRWTKEMIFVAISSDRGCQYCTAAHVACCRMLGVDPHLLEALVKDIDGIADARVRDIILFALKCSRDPQSLTEADFDTLRGHNLKRSEMMEIIGMSALAVYANIIADATAMNPDEMFATVGA